MKSPKLSTVAIPASLLFCLSVVLYYRASDSNLSRVQKPQASVYSLSKSYGVRTDTEARSSIGGESYRVEEGLDPIQDPEREKPLAERQVNVLPPGITLSHFTAYMKHQIQGEEVGFDTRRERRLAEACEEYQSVMSIPNYASYRKLYQHLLYESNHRLVYCPVWKAMSTSWDAYLLQMAQSSSEVAKDKKHYEMEGYIKRAAQARFKLSSNNKQARKVIKDSSCSVMIVRHPFQRLVSAYRDKMIARNSTVKDYLYLRTVIKHRYRTNVSEVTSFPTFHEFVDFVLDEWSSSDPRPGTWHEWSRDWHPAYYICAPCHMNYTHTLRYEHYKSDLKDFRKECHLEEITLEGTHHHQLGNTSSAQVEEELYGQLSYSQMVQLTQMYFIDLVMFGYNVSRYLQFARPD